MSRIRRLAPRLSRGGLIGNTEGPEAYLRELDTLPSRFCRASGGTETVITQGGQFYRVHTYTDVGSSALTFTRGGAVEYLVVRWWRGRFPYWHWATCNCWNRSHRICRCGWEWRRSRWIK